ncbi:baseplate J/gp47 family protein [Pantoea sp. S18]|uniref:baseplate J/gp47 family protein n=1 Tax=Pantoea sp. S18 TaxID=3019892 RepID=UPI002B20D388|nr:baseplate J/gp47 family protein [Pantoea sp. S18]MEA5101406.1 baseplate J/gp47 family protein [Pantoea sp. S18]
MTAFNIKSFTELVSGQVTAVQSRAQKLVDFSIGSILRSLAESNAGVAMWIQQLIVKLLVTTRAATCSGEDLDSWMADFGLRRLSAVQATGQVVFSRFTAAHEALIPLGTLVSTIDGSQSYTVIAPMDNKAWDAELSGYIFEAGASSLTVPVRASAAGASGNVQKGMVSIITGSIPYVDTVTNNTIFVNGKDAESDDEFRKRFITWIASLSKATKGALEYAISSYSEVTSFTLTENLAWDGTPKPGYFYAVVENSSGQNDKEFREQVFRSIDAVRGFTINFGVFCPMVITVDVVISVATKNREHDVKVIEQIKKRITEYIANLHIGQLLSYTQIIRVAYAASPLVTNVTSLSLNADTADLAASPKEVIRPGKIVVS